MLNRLPSWLQMIIVLLLVGVVVRILAPLLDVLSAYLLFGAIFLVGAALTLWKVSTNRWSPRTIYTTTILWLSLTIILYAATLEARGDDTYLWWVLTGGAVLGVGILVFWLTSKLTGNNQAARDE